MARSSTSGSSRRKSGSRHKDARRFSRFAAKAKEDYIPKEFQIKHPHLWALNVALNRVYKGKKVPDHINGPSLVRHFLRFRPLDGDKGKPMSDFTVTLQRLHQLSLNHDNWLAATHKTHRQCLQFLITPSIILAARCAYGGSRMKRWTKQQWKLVKWMIRDQNTWLDRMPSFWKDSHFESTPWIEQHLISERTLEYPVPEGIMAQDIDAWLGRPGRPKDWDAFEITPPDYPCDWAAYIRDTPPWMQAELALALIGANESTTVEGEESSSHVPGRDNKDDTNPDLQEDDQDDSVNKPNPPAQSPEEAEKHAKWEKIKHKLFEPGLLSTADIASFYPTLNHLVDISTKSKVKAQTMSEELVKKEEAINRLLRQLRAEKEELQQAINRSRQKHEDCDVMIGKIKEEIVKRDHARWPGKRQRLDENDDGVQDDGSRRKRQRLDDNGDGVQDAGSHRKRQCRDDNSDGAQDCGSHRKRQRLSLDDNGDGNQNAGSQK